MAIISYDAYVCCLKGGENKEIRSAERTPKHNKKKLLYNGSLAGSSV